MKKSTVLMVIVWLLIVPPGLTYLFFTHFHQEIHWPYIALFAVLGLFTILFPIKINGKPIYLISWVTIPTFLLFGLFFEILVMQIAIFGIFLFRKERSDMMNRMLFTSTLFFLLSIISSQAFYFAGGEIGAFDFWPTVLAISIYQIVHRGLYSIAEISYTYFKNEEKDHRTREILLHGAIVFSMLPFALSFYFLVEYIGFGAFVLIGIPFFFMIAIHRLYNSTERINNDLQIAGAIGHGLSDHLSEEKVIDQFVEKVAEMFKGEFTYLFDHHNGWLELIRSYEHGSFLNIEMNPLTAGEGVAGSVLKDNRPVIYGKREQWIDISNDYAPEGMQSIVTIPISRNQKIEGVLFIASSKRAAFNEYQLNILEILCSYFTVSVEKARNVEETVRKSERCGLTKLYNYLYLNEHLHFEETRVQHGSLQELSVVILDIDHFKKVNDTYGHQSGNDILIELAKILENHVPKNGVVGRYGGEEFIYILPGIAKKDAKVFADSLREIIEAHRFKVSSNLSHSMKTVDIGITVSIGVSALPEDTDDAKNLLRNADRALYLGAKRTGRNRVAGYVK